MIIWKILLFLYIMTIKKNQVFPILAINKIISQQLKIKPSIKIFKKSSNLNFSLDY